MLACWSLLLHGLSPLHALAPMAIVPLRIWFSVSSRYTNLRIISVSDQGQLMVQDLMSRAAYSTCLSLIQLRFSRTIFVLAVSP